MAHPDEYRELSEGTRPPSRMAATLPPSHTLPDRDDATVRIESSDLPVESVRCLPFPEEDGALWELEVELRFEGGAPPSTFGVWAAPALAEDQPDEESEADAEDGNDDRWLVGVRARYGEHPLKDYHRQLRLLSVAAPDAVVVMDWEACTEHEPEWVGATVTSAVPPSPRHLYCIHAVRSEDDSLWLHTHGLLRCGLPELEMLAVPSEDLDAMGTLMHQAVVNLIDRGLPAMGESFSVGQDLDLSWTPWEMVLVDQDFQGLGGEDDRDAAHDRPAAVLFRAESDDPLTSLSSLVPIIRDNPIFWVSAMESERMTLLARERLDVLHEVHERVADLDEWEILVKLGYETDDDGSESTREHLWFRVHAFDGRSVDATLVNDPYCIARMHAGQRDRHSLDNLTDWRVYGPPGEFNPDSIVSLRRIFTD